MRADSLAQLRDVVLHFSDAVLDRQIPQVAGQERGATAEVLIHLAEFDARRRYAPAGYPSMHAYCVEALRLSEDAAYRRIRAARAGRQFPALLVMLADGRLHLAAISVLAPHLTPENAAELMAAATYRRKSEVEQLIAQRFPDRKPPVILQPIHGESDFAKPELVPGRVEMHMSELAEEHGPAPVESPHLALSPRIEMPEYFQVQFTIDESTHDQLRYAQALLSHALPSGDVAEVFKRALGALIAQLEKRKFGATPSPRAGQHKSCGQRHIPAQVRRAVWQRDQGQCTFVSESGHRCGSPKFLEFDHIEPVARGGQATVENLRLRCRAHNQYGAEQAFGAGFMHEKRERARCPEAKARPKGEACSRPKAADVTKSHDQRPAREHTLDVIAGLRSLGVGAAEARRAAEFSERPPDASLEDCMRAALQFIAPKVKRIGFSAAAAPGSA